MSNKITGEFRFFKEQPKNVRVLLITNMLYAIILPVVEIFVAAYIMRNTSNSSFVAAYQLSMYAGIVVTSLLNGLLLRYFKSSSIYAFGIIVSAFVLMGMMFMKMPAASGEVNISEIIALCISGFVLGASTGFFWTNRYLLTLTSTNDDNRNYFFGIESFFFTFWNIVIPLAVGAFLSSFKGTSDWFGKQLSTNNGYQIITGIAFIVAILACIVLSRGKFENPKHKKFFYARFHALWNKLLVLAGLKGMVQGFLVTAPAILVMLLVGEEGSLGLIQGIAGGVTAILVYVLGRTAKPKHRMAIFGAGLLVFFAGTLFSGILFSAIGVILFILCKVFFQPLHDLAYFPTMMRTIDIVSKIENRNKYAYIMSHEIGLFFGRAAGMLLFIVLAWSISEIFALKYALIIVGALQLLSLPLAKHIVKETERIATT
ncbi:MAG: MFS transporter [Bacteroidales bacterium]|jgi:YQGE family putative transporter|nr:MFS transporter [Bacteroidales bacterium]